MSLIFLEQCSSCGGLEERIFRDSWTGTELCVFCLSLIVNYITSSPASEGDNLDSLLENQRV